MTAFDHIDTWVFDLDNTLYPASCRLFDQMDVKMGEFVSELLDMDYAAAKLHQKSLYYKHGTTLRGLMLDHGVKPEGFLDYVHNIDHSAVAANPKLDHALQQLAGRKIIFTNGTVAHAEKVLNRLGIADHFNDIYDIIAADYIPKPDAAPYQKFVKDYHVMPKSSAMFEDIARNLEVPHALGMTTVLITSPDHQDSRSIAGDLSHVQHSTSDIAAFLSAIVATRGQPNKGHTP
jgi:putative hydrolase of the HAD superfamily